MVDVLINTSLTSPIHESERPLSCGCWVAADAKAVPRLLKTSSKPCLQVLQVDHGSDRLDLASTTLDIIAPSPASSDASSALFSPAFSECSGMEFASSRAPDQDPPTPSTPNTAHPNFPYAPSTLGAAPRFLPKLLRAMLQEERGVPKPRVATNGCSCWYCTERLQRQPSGGTLPGR